MLYCFLVFYAEVSLVTAFFTSFLVFPIVFGFLLIPFPIIWILSHKQRVSFGGLAAELASMDLILIATILVFLTVL